MWILKYTGQFKKDLKRYQNQPKKIDILLKVLEHLSKEGTVPTQFDPHPLKGSYAGYLECHVENDFLLIWFDEENFQIRLVRVGTHSELFKK